MTCKLKRKPCTSYFKISCYSWSTFWLSSMAAVSHQKLPSDGITRRFRLFLDWRASVLFISLLVEVIWLYYYIGIFVHYVFCYLVIWFFFVNGEIKWVSRNKVMSLYCCILFSKSCVCMGDGMNTNGTVCPIPYT